MLSAILSCFIGALFAPYISRFAKNKAGPVIALVPLILCLYFSTFVRPIIQSGHMAFSYEWTSALCVNLSFYLDGLSLLFAMIITFIGILVILYAGTYLSGHASIGRFYALILIFMAAMLGMVLSGNIITLFVFWELTSISSYLLIGYNHEKETARKAAWQALLVTGAGGLALLAGLLLLGQAGGSYELSDLLARGDQIKAHHLYPAIFILIALGAFTKSAQYPFHFWLPNAMEAPTPVSTYLHSATMVKAGIYLLARMSPVLGETYLWHSVIIPVGAVTMIVSAYLSIRQTDLKRILAYSTVCVLGTLVFLIGTGTHSAIESAMTYVMIHALYKAALFLVAGGVDHETGSRDINKLSGLARAMPITTAAAILACCSMAGLPPLFGFIGKELLYGATLNAPVGAVLLTAVTLFTNVFMVVAAGLVGVQPFLGSKKTAPDHAHDPPFNMWFGPVLLAGLGIIIGLLPNLFAGVLISPAVASVLREPVQIKLGLLHGLNLQLALSAATFCCGAAAFYWHKKLLQITTPLSPLFRFGPSHIYETTLESMNAFATFQTRIIQNGHLHYYILIVILSTTALVWGSLYSHPGSHLPETLRHIQPWEGIIVFIILVSTWTVIRAKSRLISVIALGGVGYSVVLLFIMYGAPDLAMTQFAIDTLTVILLALVIYRLPKYVKYSKPWERIRDAIPAAIIGGTITLLTLITLAVSKGSRLSAYFSENSLLLAKGRNIVNVILVDFRALDTMGEVTVLTVAGIGVYSLLKLRKPS